ncbi:MAG: orotidine-5'-phosphate decarboxylase [Dehalococcoidia bacterium]
MKFADKLLAASRGNNSLLCVGLDPDPKRMPVSDVFDFNKAVVDATFDLVCAYKPNLAFYEALGIEGLQALQSTVDHIRRRAPGVVIIGDAKRGDVGNTAEAYARALFRVWGFDGATVNAYGGHDAILPFLEHDDRGVFIWCRSSNPGAGDLQDLPVLSGVEGTVSDAGEGQAMYKQVAMKAREWNTRGNVGLVVGATYPGELEAVRGLCPELPILVPGVGAQGGDLEASVAAGVDSKGERAIFASSRQVLYASRGSDFVDAARNEAVKLRDQINRCRGKS